MNNDAIMALLIIICVVISICFGFGIGIIYSIGLGFITTGICLIITLIVVFGLYQYLYNNRSIFK